MSYPVAEVKITFNNTGSGSVVIRDLTDSGAYDKTETLHSGVNKPFLNLVEFLKEHIEVTPVAANEGEKVKGAWKVKGSQGVPPPPKLSVHDMLYPTPNIKFKPGVQPWWPKLKVNEFGTVSSSCKHDAWKWYKPYGGTWYCTNGQHKPKPSKKKVTGKDMIDAFSALENKYATMTPIMASGNFSLIDDDWESDEA